MTGPTDEQLQRVQRQIALVQGWTSVDLFGPFSKMMGLETKTSELSDVPNWPNDRNASYDLLKEIHFAEFPYEVLTAYDESLFYLEYMGWRWEICAECDGQGKVHHKGRPCCFTGPCFCCDCSGDKGRWVKGVE